MHPISVKFLHKPTLFGKMKHLLFTLFIGSLTCAQAAFSQVGVGTANPAASAAIEVASTSKGFLLPRMTATQRASISNPVQGLLVFQTDGDAGFYYYNGLEWISLITGLAPNTAGLARPLTVTTFFKNSYSYGIIYSGSNLYWTSPDNTILKDGVTLAGSPGVSGSADGTGSAASFTQPGAITVAPDGTVYVFDKGAVRKITVGGVVSTLAGSVGTNGYADGVGSSARFGFANNILVADATGNVYVGEPFNNVLRKVTPSGVVSTLAGRAGSAGSTDGVGSSARFEGPGGGFDGLAVDAGGTLYLAGSKTIRRITSAGVVTTIAGTANSRGFADGTGAAAQLDTPSGLAFGADGALYTGDNATLRRITTAGAVTTLAGFPDSRIYINGPVPQARFAGTPYVVGAGSDGAIYVADAYISGGSSRLDIRVIK